MNFSLVAKVLWAAGFFLNTALLFVLISRRRSRAVPWFTSWIGFQVLYSVALFLAYRFSTHKMYAILYWSGAFIDLSLQIALVLEIAYSVLRRSGRWIEGARIRLILMGAIAPVIALAMAWSMRPAAATRLDAWDARASLFTTILICLLFTGVMAASQQLGLGWRSHVMREGYGLMIWVLVSFVTDTLHAYWRTAEHFSELEQVRIIFYLGSLVYWAVAFWVPERQPVALTGTENKDLEALRRRLEYGVSRSASSTDGSR